jgi:hypothetical protein
MVESIRIMGAEGIIVAAVSIIIVVKGIIMDVSSIIILGRRIIMVVAGQYFFTD